METAIRVHPEQIQNNFKHTGVDRDSCVVECTSTQHSRFTSLRCAHIHVYCIMLLWAQ